MVHICITHHLLNLILPAVCTTTLDTLILRICLL